MHECHDVLRITKSQSSFLYVAEILSNWIFSDLIFTVRHHHTIFFPDGSRFRGVKRRFVQWIRIGWLGWLLQVPDGIQPYDVWWLGRALEGSIWRSYGQLRVRRIGIQKIWFRLGTKSWFDPNKLDKQIHDLDWLCWSLTLPEFSFGTLNYFLHCWINQKGHKRNKELLTVVKKCWEAVSYCKFSDEDLGILWTWLIAQKAGHVQSIFLAR